MSIIQTDSPLFAADANTLAMMLEAYDCPAILVSDSYQIIAQNQRYSDAFGELDLESKPNCFRISHGYDVPCDQAGEACPLTAAKESGHKQRVLHIHQTNKGKEHVHVEMLPIFDKQNQLRFFVELLRPVPLASGLSIEQQMVGKSESFNAFLSMLSRVAETDASVLLLGESGSGKELAARAIHLASQRKDKPLVTLECAGLSESLIESELFGHVKGAFTGADANKKGLVELANGGTLFLDEIADVPLSTQVKLLRLLETGTYRSVGSTLVKSSDFRLITATHKNLQNLVDKEQFRQDLFFRINVFPVSLPSLSERREDIPLIAKSLLDRINTEQKYHLAQSAMDVLQLVDYIGNIRELRNIITRAVVLSDTNVIDAKIIQQCLALDSGKPAVQTNNSPQVIGFSVAKDKSYLNLRSAEKAYLNTLLDEIGDKNKVAEVAGISLRSLYRKLSI